MRLYHCLFFLTAIAGSVFAQDLSPVAERVTAQNALFEEQYETDLRNFPERATAYGDYRYNDKLADYSLAAIAQRHQTDEAFLALLDFVSPASRAVLLLHYQHDLSLEESAAILEIPIGTAKSRLHYGVATLRKHLTSERKPA